MEGKGSELKEHLLSPDHLKDIKCVLGIWYYHALFHRQSGIRLLHVSRLNA